MYRMKCLHGQVTMQTSVSTCIVISSMCTINKQIKPLYKCIPFSMGWGLCLICMLTAMSYRLRALCTYLAIRQGQYECHVLYKASMQHFQSIAYCNVLHYNFQANVRATTEGKYVCIQILTCTHACTPWHLYFITNDSHTKLHHSCATDFVYVSRFLEMCASHLRTLKCQRLAETLG